jgi:TonB-linked SusC/RagA family outer membrane protein
MLSIVRSALLYVTVGLVTMALAVADATAQQGTVTGAVTDASSGRPLTGAQVSITALQIGGLTNTEGRFVLLNVPAGQHAIEVQRLGYRTATQSVSVQSGGTAVVDFALEETAISMEGIVVTGVAGETPRSQLAFTVEQVDVAELQRIPTPTVRGLLQAKMPGVKVIQGSGQAGSEPSIQMRGPTSITGMQAPLIVIDGVITQGGIADLNTQDIASMEVVKGAAAAALYGSRAQAGVLQITTKSGAGMAEGSSEVIVRTTYEQNDLEHILGTNRSHPWQMDASGNFLDFDGNPVELPAQGRSIALDDGFNGTRGESAFADQAYPGTRYDPMRQFFDPGARITTNLSVSGNQSGTQYFISGGYTREEGAITLKDPMTQLNARLNLTQPIGEDLTLRLTSYYANRDRDLVDEQGGFVRALTFTTAQANLLRPDPDEPGGISHIGDPIDVGNAGNNPVNRLVNTSITEDRSRFIGGVDARYDALSWLSFTGNASYDRIDTSVLDYQRPGLSQLFNSTKTTGNIRQEDDIREEFNGSITASSNRQFGESFTLRTSARWLVERLDVSSFSAQGSELPVDLVPRLGIVTGTPEIDSFSQSIRSEGFFLINQFAYKDRYVGDVLIRRDGSSLFGEDERWQTYWRLSAAWRIAQEEWFNVGWLNELKPRYSIGTSGGRPTFEAQYQTFDIDRGQIIPRTLGNADLKPELATEQEFGVDMVIANRLQIQASYVDTRVEDQLLLVPQTSAQGFEAQWRNAGTVESDTYELSLEAALIDNADMRWTARLNLDQTESIITELNTPSYEQTNPGLSRSRMRVAEGERIGSFYGFQFLGSCADLASSGGGAPCDQFDVNDMGYLVYVGSGNTYQDGIAKDLWGTTGTVNGRSYRWGFPIEPDADSELFFAKLGDSQPDLNASLSQDFQWGNLGASFLLDGEWGAQIYNMSQQWQCRDWHCEPADMRGVPDELKKPISYFGALQARNQPNSAFVEDADFVKLREVSIRYTLTEDVLPGLMTRAGVSQATINLIGRNVKTWTDYKGFDPEVGADSFGGSAVVGRVDEWFVPNFRSFGIDVELIF